MTFNFNKYQGTGNDFIMIDNRQLFFPKNNTKLIKQLCDRKFGIGADGLILLEAHDTLDFKMVYYNADGNPSSMCGNGGRCIVAFAKALTIIQDTAVFEAIGQEYTAFIKDEKVHLKMQDVADIRKTEDYIFLDTGSPHHIEFVDDFSLVDVKTKGAKIRYSELYGAAGSNVNFVNKEGEDTFKVRTYERGVEDETLSCGTGVTAVALGMHYTGHTTSNTVQLLVEGGKLEVSFEKEGDIYNNVYLIGAATFVYKGSWSC